MRIKRRLRTAVERAAHWSGLLARFEREARSGLTILTYHRVLPDEQCADYPFPSLVMPVTAFRAQMEHLARRCDVSTVGAAFERLRAGRPSGVPLVAVTFDDGYDDNRAVAARVLDELGLRATFFVVTKFVEERRELWFDRAARVSSELGRSPEETAVAIESLKSLDPAARDAAIDGWSTKRADGSVRGRAPVATFSPMTREDVTALSRSGHEIAAHTESHAVLTHVDDATLARELAGAKRTLEAWTGTAVDGLAYPNGDHDARVVEQAIRTGYRWACTTQGGRNDRSTDVLRLKRVDVTPTRVTDHRGDYSEIAFRSEISLLRGRWRHARRRGGST